jgi:hypothetical protein
MSDSFCLICGEILGADAADHFDHECEQFQDAAGEEQADE